MVWTHHLAVFSWESASLEGAVDMDESKGRCVRDNLGQVWAHRAVSVCRRQPCLLSEH